ncbi:hypothetical protein NDU88_003421 [Pleurodeles waltl]|uniref:Uncharacterized protein n=1 Tax=Pleurodeles waltl TaxID=8319 RepID=A0AAV7SEG4_PLEWA|nr:hypothetical protein NDU88_003421 [Pleurodeles waltl]
MGRRVKRKKGEAEKKDDAENDKREKSGAIHRDNYFPARESDEEDVWPAVRQGMEKSDEEGMRPAVHPKAEESEDPDTPGKQTEGSRHVPGGT